MSVGSRNRLTMPLEAGERLRRSGVAAGIADRLVDRVGADTASAWAMLSMAMIVGAFVRLLPLSWGQGFPLNDGGMFMAMVDDLKAGGYRLPEFTSYNGGNIPFAYPSLPFYAAAALSDLAGWSTLQVLQFLPAVFSLLTLPAFYLLARAILPTRTMAALAVMLLAVTPRAFNWEIVGGGLTRSPALFFAVLALWQGYQLFSTQQRRHVVPAAVLSALAIYCHMEMGWFVAFSMAYFVLALGGLRRNLGVAIALATLVPVLTAPWWLETMVRVGPEPFLAAMQTGAHSPFAPLRFLTLVSTDEPFFPIVLGLALLGLGSRLQARDYFLPLWLLLIFVLDPRKAATTSTLPLALMASCGLVYVVLPAVRSKFPARSGAIRASRWGYIALAFLLLLYAPAAAIGSAASAGSPLFALKPSEREAMAWVRENTPDNARFLIPPVTKFWALDASSEWFPALAGRYSVATVQGAEWLPEGRFKQLDESHDSLMTCGYQGVDCIERWSSASGTSFDYIYVPKGIPVLDDVVLPLGKMDCCAELRAGLSASEGYERIYDNAGASIYRKLP